MSSANTITKQQYEDGKSELLAASELEQSGRYNARLKLDALKLGEYAIEYAIEDYLRIINIDRDESGFKITMASELGVKSDYWINLNGILYALEANSTDERGYLRTPPLGDWDRALEDEISKLEPAQRIIQHKAEPNHFELPQSPDVDSPTHTNKPDFF